MSTQSIINIETTYASSQLGSLISVLEGNLDLDHVVVRRSEYAVKAIYPLEIIISATSGYLLKKFVLAPLIDPIAEKFNWVTAVKKYLSPLQPFNLTVTLDAEGLTIEAPLESSHRITAEIWSIINSTLDLLEAENMLNIVSRIRFTPKEQDSLLILCYVDKKPMYVVDIERKKLSAVPSNQSVELKDTDVSAEDWVKKKLEESERYRRFIDKSL